MDETKIMTVDAVSQLQRMETETQIDIAKRYPRSITKAKKQLLDLATCDEETASRCFYSKPVDNKGTVAEGPSIRLAEIAANCYGNIRYGARVIEESEKWVKVQGVCIDLENNIVFFSEQQRSIYSEKQKYRYSQNMIEVTMKAAAAIAVRDAVFKVVPLGLFSAEMKKIKEVGTGKASGVPLTQRISNAFSYFYKLGVSEARVLERLGIHGKDEITEDHMETLVGLKTAIEDKETSVEEAFRAFKKEESDQKANDVADGVKNMMGKGNKGTVDKGGQINLV